MRIPLSLFLFIIFSCCVLHSHLAVGEEEIESPEEEGAAEATEEGEEISADDNLVLYFYRDMPGGEGILEYEAPDGGEWDGKTPDFVYQPEKVPGIRIVEFYAHWCPHCQHFRDHYIRFAQTTREIVKQYSPGTTINMFAISCVPWRPICVDFGVDSYPRLMLFEDGSTEGTVINPTDVHPFKVLSLLNIHLDDMAAQEEMAKIEQEEEEKSAAKTTTFRTKKHKHKDSKEPFWLPRTKQDIYNDAHLSFDFAMRNSIFLENKPLGEKAAKAFYAWIEQLASALPPTWVLKSCVAEIFASIEKVVQSEKALLAIVDKYPPKKKKWSHACMREDKYAGYTCGLWELFHIMTVGAVEWNVYSNGDDWYFFRPGEVANVLRNYIEHFFGCEVCRHNFLHAFDSCEYDRCTRLIPEIGDLEEWKEIPLWLFETHNGVNRRLARERAERDNRDITEDEYEAVKWPSRHECPRCWGEDGSWNSEIIYDYLRVTYWPDDALNLKMREFFRTPSSIDDDEEMKEEEQEEEGSRFVLFLKRLLKAVCASYALTYATSFFLHRRRLRTGHHKKV